MKVKDLLYSPTKWLKNSFAKDENGKVCHSTDDQAACWCVMGAIIRCYPTKNPDDYNRYCDILDSILEEIAPHTTISVWNDMDTTSFEDMRKVIEKLNI